MKRKILVLDAFTNGHEAALRFIKQKGWDEDTCQIVFCGTHKKVFEQLIQGPAYAVVPIHNSSVGEITEVTKELRFLRDQGYTLEQRSILNLKVNHCLLAPQHITHIEDLDCVLSHEKALAQCAKFLDSIQIVKDKRVKSTSTGNAAKLISKSPKEYPKTGAIASSVAAKEYGLNILAENIQDNPNNRTTFILLENKAFIDKNFVVGIIGIKGRFGDLLKNFFEKNGIQVIGSDTQYPTGFTNEQVVQKSKVVIFCIPIKETPSTINSLIPYFREDQLLMDITSIKQPAIEVMLQSRSQVVGLHPMFRPEVSFNGQTIIVCPARLTSPEFKTWLVNILATTQTDIKWSTSAEHDKFMTIVQVIPHLGNLTGALLISELGVSISESLDFTSPFYRVMFSLMGRLISQNPDLYSSIILENPETLTVLKKRISIEQNLVQLIEEKNYPKFEKLFEDAKEHFGQEVVQDANELFMRLLGVLSTLYGKNSIILEFTQAEDKPRLLEKVLAVFGNYQINLSGINSVWLTASRLQFTISFEQSRSSEEVRRALEEIESWSDLKPKILIG